jgi:hypothetical protein
MVLPAKPLPVAAPVCELQFARGLVSARLCLHLVSSSVQFVSIGVNFNGKVTRQQLVELVARGGFTFRLEPVIYDGCLIDKRHPEFNGMASFSDSDDE